MIVVANSSGDYVEYAMGNGDRLENTTVHEADTHAVFNFRCHEHSIVSFRLEQLVDNSESATTACIAMDNREAVCGQGATVWHTQSQSGVYGEWAWSNRTSVDFFVNAGEHSVFLSPREEGWKIRNLRIIEGYTTCDWII
eukprot:gene23452-28389_t